MKPFLACLSAALFLCSPAVAEPDWPDLFKKAVTPDFGTGQVVAYDKTFTSLTGTEALKIHYDGSATTPETRVRLLWIRDDLKEHADKILASIREDEDDEIWCDGRSREVNSNVTLVSEDADKAVYSYQPTDPEDEQARKVMESSTATLTVNKASGQIEKAVIKLNEPVKPLPVAKVLSLTVDAECEVSSIGRPYLKRVLTDMELSIMFKKNKDQKIEIIDNLTFPGLSEDK